VKAKMDSKIVLITKDALSKDYLPVYGNKYWNTPNISELANKGTIFNRFYTAAPSSVMSYLSMFTGEYPYQSDKKKYVHVNKEYQGDTLFDKAAALGYECHIIWDEHWIEGAKKYSECYGQDTIIHSMENLRQGVGSHYIHKGILERSDCLAKDTIHRIEKEVKDIFSGQTIWSGDMVKLISSPYSKTWQDYQEQASQLGTVNRCQIHIITPLRVKSEGHLSNELKFSTIFKAIVRRWSLLNKYYGSGEKEDLTELVNQSSKIPSGTLNLRWREMERYSRRQDQRMLLGGLVGIMECEGEITPFLPWLLLGQDILIGKNTSFGLGGYRLKNL